MYEGWMVDAIATATRIATNMTAGAGNNPPFKIISITVPIGASHG